MLSLRSCDFLLFYSDGCCGSAIASPMQSSGFTRPLFSKKTQFLPFSLASYRFLSARSMACTGVTSCSPAINAPPIDVVIFRWPSGAEQRKGSLAIVALRRSATR